MCVSSCFNEFENIKKNAEMLRKSLIIIQEEYEKVSHLESAFRDLTNEAIKHKQLLSAKENVENVLSIDDLIELAYDNMKENRPLDAHKCLTDIEKSRDAILEEISTPRVDLNNFSDIKLVEKYFEKSKIVQDELEKQLFLAISQFIDIAETEPNRLVTALRIIEREEL